MTKRRPQLARSTKELLHNLAMDYTVRSVAAEDARGKAQTATSAAYCKGRSDAFNMVALDLLRLVEAPVTSDPTE